MHVARFTVDDRLVVALCAEKEYSMRFSGMADTKDRSALGNDRAFHRAFARPSWRSRLWDRRSPRCSKLSPRHENVPTMSHLCPKKAMKCHEFSGNVPNRPAIGDDKTERKLMKMLVLRVR